MIDYHAFYSLSYGLYLVCSGSEKKGNGFISNTFFQVTSEPAQFAACCNKDNFTAGIIQETGFFSVSVLHQETPFEFFGRFGYRSGRDFNKMEGITIQYGSSGTPIVLSEAVAWLECKLLQTVDVGSHWIFIGELLASAVIDASLPPITYDYYRNVKKGLAPKNAPTFIDPSKVKKPSAAPKPRAKHICAACGHVHDDHLEETPFAELPEDWTCPICGADKEDFYPE